MCLLVLSHLHLPLTMCFCVGMEEAAEGRNASNVAEKNVKDTKTS